MKRTTKFNKIMAVILCMMMVLSTFTIVPMTASAVDAPASADKLEGAAVAPTVGDGSKDNPYEIASAENYKWMVATAPNWNSSMTYCELTTDINFEGATVAGISGTGWVTVSLDGQDHTIYNMTTAWGMFDCIGRDKTTGEVAVIKNLNLVGYKASRAGAAAGIALNSDGLLIDNVNIDETSVVSSTGDIAAAFVVRIRSNTLTIKNSSNAAAVSAGTHASAFVVTQNGNTATAITLENCVNKGNVKAAQNVAAMFAYREEKSATLTIKKCINYGDITTTSTTETAGAGAMLGYHWKNTGALTVQDCVNYGNVTAEKVYVGGLIGYLRTTPGTVLISGCLNEGLVKANQSRFIGGIVGYINHNYVESGTASITLSGNRNTADMSNANFAGGIVGSISEIGDCPVTVTNCVNDGNISTKSNSTGGIVGYVGKSVVNFSGCVNNGDVTGTGNHTGGIVGAYSMQGTSSLGYTPTGITFEKCVNHGNVTGGLNAGGIASAIEFNTAATPLSEKTLTFTYCVNTGKVVSTSTAATNTFVGGIAGDLNSNALKINAEISYCYNLGDLSSSSVLGSSIYPYLGGIVGRDRLYLSTAENAVTNVDHCFSAATQAIASAGYNSNLIGWSTGDETTVNVSNSYSCNNLVNGASHDPSYDSKTNYGTVATINTVIAELNNSTIAKEIAKINKEIVGATAKVDISTASANLSVRLKMTAPFGFMAITTVKDAETNQSIAYHNSVYTLKFAFLASDAAITDANVIINSKDATVVETVSYLNSPSMQCAEYTGLTAPEMSDTIYFVCYLEDTLGNVVSASEVRDIVLYDIVKDAADGEIYGQSIENAREVALYQKIVEYCDAYDKYVSAN